MVLPYVYVYATGRDDGWAYCVGIAWEDKPVDGAVALFRDLTLAEIFANEVAIMHNGSAEVLPSARR